MERSMIDAASGGALGDMTPAEARNLIEKMASNSQQFSARNDDIVIRGVNEVATNSSSPTETKKLEGKLDALVNLVTQLALNQKSVLVTRLCGLCSFADHHTDLFPSVQQLNSLKLMLQTSTIDLLNLSSKISHNRTIMTSPAIGTIPGGGIIPTLDG